MFETKSNYNEFAPLAKSILEEKGRNNLASLLYQPKIKNLFLHNVDHPMGYQDSPSQVSYLRLKRRTKDLTDKDKNKLYQTSEILLRAVENGELCSKEKLEALLGANQLVQNASWKTYGPDSRNKFRQNLLERISKVYIENPEDIDRVKEWDAQVAENKGFYHIEKGMDMKTIMIGMFGTLPSMAGVGALFGREAVENFMLPLFAGGVLTIYANQFLLLPLQDFFGDKKSPNTSSKLITGRQYKFMRHPLYASRMLGDILFGVASFPFGTYSCGKALYHNVKGSENQDERMRILHGDEAVDYQKKTSAMIPGTKFLMKGLRKVLPEKICDTLDTPVSYYLGKIPGIKDENHYTDDWVTSPSYNKGSPTFHIGAYLEESVRQNPLKDLAEIPGLYYKDGKLAYNWVSKKIRKKWNKRKRRLAWEKSNQLEKNLVTQSESVN